MSTHGGLERNVGISKVDICVCGAPVNVSVVLSCLSALVLCSCQCALVVSIPRDEAMADAEALRQLRQKQLEDKRRRLDALRKRKKVSGTC